MRILHIIVDLDVGGAEMMLKRLIESDPVQLSSAVVVSLTSLGVIGESLRARGVRVLTLGMTSPRDFPLTLWRGYKLIRRFQPEIVQTWMYHADLLGGLAALFANQRVIWGIRTTDIGAGGSLGTVLVRWLCARISGWVPDAIICAAEAARQSHVAIGYDAKKMCVVPNGYNFAWLSASADERASLRKQFGISSNNIVLGSLGRFHVDKDQNNFVKAAGLLATQYPELRFLMVGRGLVWENTQLAQWVVATGFKDRFFLLGERKDVPQCLAAMDMFCLHSRTEGFPNVLAEAMAMGLPCITTDVGDAAMLLADTGVVVPSEHVDGLVQGIAKMLSLDVNERAAMGVRAKARIESDFSIACARERFEKIYQQVLQKESF